MIVFKEIAQKFNSHKICVIIPTYNNEKTLGKIIDDVSEYTENIIVVNDGSTDSTNEILLSHKNISLISYPDNVGKGWALRQGFQYAIKHDYNYAITIDSDGQHFASDIPKFIDKLEESGDALIIGARNMNQESVPGKSTTGLKISNFWFNVETGIEAPDTQSGYRLFPLQQLKDLKFHTKKFEFEIEVIVRAAWKGVKIESVPVTVFYAKGKDRVTHFRPFKDFTRIGILHFILVTITFCYINPRNFLRKLFDRSSYHDIRKQIFNADESNSLISLSIAFGIFMGIVPIWGFQLIVGIFLAVLFRLNKALVIIAANISIPPMIPIIIFLSFKMGSIWIGKAATPLNFSNTFSLDTIYVNFIQYIYGSITLAFTASLLFGSGTYLFLSLYRKQHHIKQ